MRKLFIPQLAITRSIELSLLRSPIAINDGNDPFPVEYLLNIVNVPFAYPLNIQISSKP